MHELKTNTAETGYTILDFATTEEWKEARQDGIGASAVGILLGLNHFSTPQKLYAQIQRLIPTDGENDTTQRGHRLEPVVAADFAAATGSIIMEESAHDFLCVDAAKPWRRISPDRFAWPEGTPLSEQTVDNAFIVECKTCQPKNEFNKHIECTPENVFDLYPYWYAQVQYQMAVCRKKYAYLCWIDCLNPNLPFNYVFVEYDEPAANMALDIVDDFWLNHILEGVEPDEVINDEDAQLKWRKSIAGTTVVADDAVREAVRRHLELDAQMKSIEKEDDALKVVIRSAMQENEILRSPEGAILCTWRNGAPVARLDAKRLKAEAPTIYEKYLGEAKASRILRFTGNAA